MEDIALFVLPSDVRDEDSDGGPISNQAVKLEARSESDGVEASALNSFGLSDAGSEPGHEQTSVDFKKLLSVEVPEVDANVALWTKDF